MPLFGETDKTKTHVVGRYNVPSRKKMWTDILRIVEHYDSTHQTSFRYSIHHELKVKMSFHIMEMFCGASKSELIELWFALSDLKLMYHPVPLSMWTINFIFGRNSLYFYRAVRKVFQR